MLFLVSHDFNCVNGRQHGPEIAQLDVDCAFLLITLNNRPHVHTFKSICDYKYDKGDL